MRVMLTFYFLAFVFANLIVNHFGAYGLWFSSFFLIPFDFIARCIIHERFKGIELFLVLFFLTSGAASVTCAIYSSALFIALGSICGFTAAQIFAGIFYQANIKKSLFLKVNGSDMIAIIADSIVFQLVAFGNINPLITLGQIVIKGLGGLMWYFILKNKIKSYGQKSAN